MSDTIPTLTTQCLNIELFPIFIFIYQHHNPPLPYPMVLWNAANVSGEPLTNVYTLCRLSRGMKRFPLRKRADSRRKRYSHPAHTLHVKSTLHCLQYFFLIFFLQMFGKKKSKCNYCHFFFPIVHHLFTLKLCLTAWFPMFTVWTVWLFVNGVG